MMNKLIRYLNLCSDFPASFSDKKNVFILSHMRSTSTLLSHVLSSHEKICGHRELHSSYTNLSHKIKTRSMLYQEKDSYIKSEYVLDKVLHNKLIINESVFSQLPKYIFLLREPKRTMTSMIKMHLKDNNTEDSLYKLEEYYINRVECLTNLWLQLRGDKIYISSEDLTVRTSHTLEQIARFLSLDTPFQEAYSTYSDTGVNGIGDASEHIRSGKILSHTNQDARCGELLNHLNLDKIEHCYQNAVSLFRS